MADPRFMFLGLLSLALGCFSAAVITPKIIEAQARQQCLAHAWSPESHAEHMKFCQTYGYPTSDNYSTFNN